MAKYNWRDINREDVINAIRYFFENNPEYPEPRSTFLVYNGKKLPAKHIRGMAYKEHYGVEIRKGDFSGGMETVKFFERLGFEVDYSKSYVKKIGKTGTAKKLQIVEKKNEELSLVEESFITRGGE